ncbi:unnamed protein product [Ceratitis capitata]|uniref:(Mediterranean fruit fly) hypothetical protein n=1 Tax=Ceratitis capitata TaxID=7213 RepID=A0A811VGI0_CERCA|nr:unnamed protein product [Ceratitis capitata]
MENRTKLQINILHNTYQMCNSFQLQKSHLVHFCNFLSKICIFNYEQRKKTFSCTSTSNHTNCPHLHQLLNHKFRRTTTKRKSHGGGKHFPAEVTRKKRR